MSQTENSSTPPSDNSGQAADKPVEKIPIHPGVAVACAVALVALAGVSWVLRGQNEKLSSEMAKMEEGEKILQTTLEQERTQIRGMIATMSENSNRARRTLSTQNMLLASVDLKIVILNGKAPAADAASTQPAIDPRGRVFFDPKERLIQVLGIGLPVPGKDKALQIWSINEKGEKVSLGGVEVNDKGVGHALGMVPPEAGTPVAFELTLEPAEGSKQPTTGAVLSGKF